MPDPGGPRDPAARAAWERELGRLRETYRIKLRGELASLAALLGEARTKERGGPALEDARRLAHRLKGTAGSYQLDETCAALEGLEAGLDRLRATAPADAAPLWAAAEEALGRAREGSRDR